MYSKLTEVDKYIRANYLGELDENTLNNYIAKGYVAGLSDRYSTYYTPEEYTNELNAYKGNLMGIGVSVSMDSSGISWFMMYTKILQQKRQEFYLAT